MCGLCGVFSGFLSQTEIKLFENLLFMCQLRGEDATGMISVTRPTEKEIKKQKLPDVKFYKEVNEASYMLRYGNEPGKRNILGGSSKRLILGHTRSGTRGAKEKVTNAHPFNFPNVIGMHNGTISKLFKHSSEYETDSEALYRNLNDYGLEETLNEISSYTSSYALQWINREDQSLNFIRNTDRPLWFTKFSGDRSIAWASESWMIQAAIHRLFENQKLEIWQPKANFHYKFYFNQEDESKLLVPEVTEIKVKAPFTATTHYSKHGIASGFESNTSVFHKSTSENTPWYSVRTKTVDATKKPVIKGSEDLDPVDDEKETDKTKETNNLRQNFYRGFHGESLTGDQFDKILMNGCAICTEQPSIFTPRIEYKIGWISRDEFACESCMSTEEWVRDYVVNETPSKLEK